MKKVTIICILLFLFVVGVYLGLSRSNSKWSGVDESVVEKIAIQAGRPPKEPLINTDKGDLLLFCFLLGGALGGFWAGYCFRELFPSNPDSAAKE